MSEEVKGLFQSFFAGSVAADHPLSDTHPILAAPTMANHFNVVKVAIKTLACFKLEDTCFEFDSSFIMPEAATEIKNLSRLKQKHGNALLSVFGHADPTGNEDYNKKLSGQRALAMYSLLIRDVSSWETLNRANTWGIKAIQQMLGAAGHDAGIVDGVLGEKTRGAIKDFQMTKSLVVDGVAGPTTRRELYKVYMDTIAQDESGKPFKLEKKDFLAKGIGKDLKGDIQGCGEFNPLFLFSNADKTEFDKKENESIRNGRNMPNRRVMILLFKPGTQIDSTKWPCPSVIEGVAGCKKRFFSDGEERMQNSEEEREFSKTKDTFACRFYQRLQNTSPCEKIITTAGFATWEVTPVKLLLSSDEILLPEIEVDSDPSAIAADNPRAPTLRQGGFDLWPTE